VDGEWDCDDVVADDDDGDVDDVVRYGRTGGRGTG